MYNPLTINTIVPTLNDFNNYSSVEDNLILLSNLFLDKLLVYAISATSLPELNLASSLHLVVLTLEVVLLRVLLLTIVLL